MSKSKKHSKSISSRKVSKLSKNVKAPGKFSTNGSRRRVDTFIDFHDSKQRKRFKDASKIIWEYLRHNKNYQSDFKKYCLSRKSVPSSFASKEDYFWKEYGILFPLNPDYFYSELFSKNKISGRKDIAAFLGFFMKLSNQSPGFITILEIISA